MRLFGTELRRFFARRATRWMFLTAIVVIAVGLAITANHSKFREQSVGQSCATVNGVTRCRTDVVRADNRIVLRQNLRDAIGGTGVAMLLLSVLLGATFVGADYVGGSLAGQLLFEPRRTQVFVAKAASVAIACALLVTVLLVLVSVGVYGVAEWRGVVSNLDSTWLTRRAADVGRVTAACAVLAAVAFCITTLARRTVAAVVGFLASLAVVEPALSALKIFKGRTPIHAFVMTTINDFSNPVPGFTSLTRSVVVAAIWSAAILVFGAVAFARREIR